MELWRYYRILRKRKWLIIIGSLICVGIVAIATYMGGQKWEAYTTVMEKIPGDDKVTIFSPTALYQIDPKLRLANLTQLVKSQTVVERSAETLWRLGVISDPEEIRDILSTLDVTPLLDTMILVIKVQSDSEDRAKATADVVAAEFIRYYNDLNYAGVRRSRRFIKAELPKAEARLNEARERLRRFKEETGTSELTAQTSVLLQRLSQLEISLGQQRIQAQEARARVEGLEAELSKYPATRVASRVISSNPVWQQLQIELARLEAEYQKMVQGQKRTLQHPDVIALARQIEETKAKIAEAGDSMLSSETQAADPVHDNLLQNYVAALSERAAAEAAVAAAEEVVATIKPELESLPSKEMRLAQLQLDVDSARNTCTLLRQKLDEATIKEQEAENVSSIEIVDPAKTRPADPRKPLKLLLAVILGPAFCSGIAFLLNYLDNTIKTPAEAENLLKLPVFAVVPIAKHHSLAEGKYLPAIGTSYQMLSTSLWLGNTDMEGRTILVASAEPDVGRSTTAVNLAITLAKDGARVILVDADLRQPSLHKILNVDNEKGLSNVLAGQLSVKDALIPTSINDLLVIPSGPLPSNPIRLFRSPEMAKFVAEVNDMADFVIFDSPAGITFADSTLLAALVKNVVIVHAAGTVPRGSEDEFRSMLEQAGANLLGAVLNMVRPEDSHTYYHFRSAYEELMKDGKETQALPGRVVSSMTENDDAGDGEA